MKTKHLLLVALVFLFACKKKDYTNNSTSTQPVFYFNGSINRSPVNIEAGVNNYYLNTTYSMDSNGVYDFTGEFMNASCTPTCPNSLVVYIKDFAQKPVISKAHVDSLLITGYYSYATPAGQPTGYYVNFTDNFNQTALSYSWDFGNGQTGVNHNPVAYYYHPGIYKVTLTTTSTSCSSSDTNNAIIGQVGNAFLTPFSNGSFTLNWTKFAAVPNGVPPYSYHWSFGDGGTSDSATPYHQYVATGVYEVTCSNTDALGYTAESRFNIPTPSATGCANGFWQGTIVPNANPYNLNNVGIEWYDNSGALWKSENNKQHANSLFQVSAVSDYKNNGAGQAVKMLTAIVSCELYNGTDSIPLSGTMVFGVAHY